MNDKAELLAMLRDIQQPTAPESSSALFVVLASLFFLSLIACLAIVWYRRNGAVSRAVQREIKSIRALPNQQAIHQLAILLRRVMHHMHGDSINQLQGKPWLTKLNTSFSTTYFENDRGRVFGDALYQNHQRSSNELPDTSRLCDDISYLIARLDLRS